MNLSAFIGWNYSIQTGENISTNERTQIYNRSHVLQPGLIYLNLKDSRDQDYLICSILSHIFSSSSSHLYLEHVPYFPLSSLQKENPERYRMPAKEALIRMYLSF